MYIYVCRQKISRCTLQIFRWVVPKKNNFLKKIFIFLFFLKKNFAKIVKNCQKFWQNLHIFSNFCKQGSFFWSKLMFSRRLSMLHRVSKRVKMDPFLDPGGVKFGPSVHTLCTPLFPVEKHNFCPFWTPPEKNFRKFWKFL